MATKAKTTTKKRTTAQTAKKTVKSASAATVKTKTAAAKNTNSTDFSWLTSSKTVFRPKTALGALLAELIGTFVLASLFLAGKGNLLFILFGIIGVTFATLRLSGAHLNPAISLAAWVTRHITGWRMLGFVIAQVLGAMLALLVANWLLPIQPADSGTFLQQTAAPTVYHVNPLPKDKEWHLFFAQMLGTGIFAFAFASAWDALRGTASKALTIGFGYFAGLALTAQFAILNPAVAVALGAIKWDLWALAIFIAAPAIGALIGAGLYKLFAKDVDTTENSIV